MTNLYAQVLNRLAPWNCPILAVMASSASGAAWYAKSSSSGPEIRNRGARRLASLQAMRTGSSYSRASAASGSAPCAGQGGSHPADSGSIQPEETAVSVTIGSAGTMAAVLTNGAAWPALVPHTRAESPKWRVP